MKRSDRVYAAHRLLVAEALSARDAMREAQRAIAAMRTGHDVAGYLGRLMLAVDRMRPEALHDAARDASDQHHRRPVSSRHHRHLRAALECLRDNAHGPTREWREGAAMRTVSDAIRSLRLTHLYADAEAAHWSALHASRAETFLRYRILRARLALTLRAMLRVAAIEHAEAHDEWWCHDSTRTRVVCAGCGEVTNYKHGELMERRGDGSPDLCPKTGRIERARNAVPLWEQAPQTKC